MNQFDRIEQIHNDLMAEQFKFGFASGALFMIVLHSIIYHKQVFEDIKSVARLVKSIAIKSKQ